MEKPLRKKLYYLFFILMGHCLSMIFMGDAVAQTVSPKSDRGTTFPAYLDLPTIDFNLQSTGEKKFKVVLEKKAKGSTRVKIYDILGNLVKEDKIEPEDGKEKSFDFSDVNSQLFVVEVGNSKFNKTKSIYAQSPGSRKKSREVSE